MEDGAVYIRYRQGDGPIQFPPLAADHPLVTREETCPLCFKEYAAGDITGAVANPDEDEQLELLMGGYHTVRATITHWSCLGRCCICEQEGPTVRNVCFLDLRSPEPDRGCWGCFQCGLPMAGAISVLCDHCRATKQSLKFACLGYPGENRRIPLDQLTTPFCHDMSKHPGEEMEVDEDGNLPYESGSL